MYFTLVYFSIKEFAPIKITCYRDIIKVGCIYLDTMQIQIQSE